MFETFLVQPIYNIFIALVSVVPQGDAGLAIIALTLIMRLVLYPVFTASIRTQMGMTAMQSDVELIKEKHKNDKEALAREQIALFKKHKVNPLAGFGALFIQLGVLIPVCCTLLYQFPQRFQPRSLGCWIFFPPTTYCWLFWLVPANIGQSTLRSAERLSTTKTRIRPR